MAQGKEHRILIVDRDEDTRESIASTFALADLSSTIAEEKSVARAITHLLNADLNVLIIGPNLNIEEAKKLHTCPSSFGDRVTICLNEDIAELLECKNILLIPFLPEDGKIAVHNAFKKSQNPATKADDNEPRVNEAMQLAFVISRLVDRMQRISDALKKSPKDSQLTVASIPEAINMVIARASTIRQGHETEDINALVKELFK